MLKELLEYFYDRDWSLGSAERHRQGHQPAEVPVNSVTGRCWLMGFVIASQLPRERQSAQPPEFIAGTLAGLYALGVTL
jgi:hypothetical protein